MKNAVDKIAEDIASALRSQMGVKGRGLWVQLRRAGRRLPADVRHDIEQVIEAQAFAQSPKTQNRVILPSLKAAERRVLAYLRNLDPNSARRAAVFDALRGLAINAFLGVGAIFSFLIWKGVI